MLLTYDRRVAKWQVQSLSTKRLCYSRDMKTYPNKQRYHEILKGMSPQEKLEKVFELTELANAAFMAGLKNRHPHLSSDELNQLYIKRRQACHNQNY